jgi:cytoskeletal protein RodZ
MDRQISGVTGSMTSPAGVRRSGKMEETMRSTSKIAAMAIGLSLALGSAGFAQSSSSTTTTEKPDGQKSSTTNSSDPSKQTSTTTASNGSGQSSTSSTTQHNDGTKTTTKTDKN